ncbi:ABC transporter ATP-binding protein [bacterium]|nr:ABC transporter ATP-binding protein [bacterium]
MNKYLQFYLDRMRKYSGRFATALIFMFLFTLLNTSVIFMVKTIVDEVFVKAQMISKGQTISSDHKITLKKVFSKDVNLSIGDDKDSTAIQGEGAKKYLINSLIIISIVFIFIYLLKGIFWYIRKYMMLFIGERIVLDLRNDIYRHVQNLSVRYFDRAQTGEIMSRITNDVTLVQQTVALAGTQIVQEPINFVFALAVLIYLNWQLTVVSVLVVGCLIYPVSVLSRKMKNAAKASQEKIGNLSSIMQEIIGGVRIVKAFNMEEYEIGKFKGVNREYFNAMMKGNRAWALLNPSNEFLASIAISIAIVQGGLQIAAGTMTTGTFFAYFLALFSLYRPTRTIMEAFSTLRKSYAAVDRIEEILNERIRVVEAEDPLPIDQLEKSIHFNEVFFHYDEGNPVLRGLELEITKGETVAFVGESGAGKSTIASLLLRFYDVVSGNILIDGEDLRNYSIKDVRGMIGFVAQETFLFNDTIQNNITYGRKGVSRELMLNAADNSHCREFIEGLPNGFDTIIGERGYALSGGQRQRISIARALIKDPEILVLDEATSALDSESEKSVQSALDNLMKGRTNIIIAHRLSTIVNSDRILVLKKGVVEESGTHQKLMEKRGVYWNLYNVK